MLFPVFFGSGSLSVVFSFARGRVVCRVPSRAAAARLLLRFRRARRWWRSAPRPGSSAWVRGGFSVPVAGLRWLACRPVVVCVRGSVGGRRRSAWVVSVPGFLRSSFI